MNLHRLILAGILLIATSAAGQGKEKKVTVILNTLDSFQGYIDDKEWLNNPNIIRIKRNLTDTYKEYAPAQIHSLEIEGGDRYLSALVKIDDTPTEFDTPAFDPALVYSEEKHVFLLTQYNSPEISLYSYRYKNKNHFFLQKMNETPQELIMWEYTVRKESKIYKQEDKIYREQLAFLAENCDKLKDRLGELEYNEQSFSKFFTYYSSNCGRKEVVYLHRRGDQSKFGFSLTAGASISEAKFTANGAGTGYIDVITEKPLGSKTSPSFGLRLVYFIPRAHQKLSVAIDAYYNKYNSSVTEYVRNMSPQDYQIKTLNIDFTYLHSTVGVRYFLNRENNTRPFLSAGVGFSKQIAQNSSVTREVENNGTHTVSSNDPFPENSLKKSSFSFMAGAGVVHKRFGIDYRVLPMAAITFLTSIKSSFIVNSILLSYQLNK